MKIDNVLELVGILVPLLSTVASWFNGKARAKKESGEVLSPAMARAGAVLNVGALNFDKAMQLLKAVQAALPKKEEDSEKQGE